MRSDEKFDLNSFRSENVVHEYPGTRRMAKKVLCTQDEHKSRSRIVPERGPEARGRVVAEGGLRRVVPSPCPVTRARTGAQSGT